MLNFYFTCVCTVSKGTQQVKTVQKESLQKMVAFAENRTDCRREMQLNYFGEIYDSKLCSKNLASACDNCLGEVCKFDFFL